MTPAGPLPPPVRRPESQPGEADAYRAACEAGDERWRRSGGPARWEPYRVALEQAARGERFDRALLRTAIGPTQDALCAALGVVRRHTGGPFGREFEEALADRAEVAWDARWGAERGDL